MSEANIHDDFIRWYKDEKDTFKGYAEYVCNSIVSRLPERRIYPASYSSREKNIDSLINKCKRLVFDSTTGKETYKYTDPKKQITDLSGARIVTYTKSDLSVVCSVIEKMFNVDPQNSMDKKHTMAKNEVGYLSIHYIVSLKEDDPQYIKYPEMKCEVQVRTVLQDAWAQVFHDRQYKPLGNEFPPSDILRDTHLVAGTLELIDEEIDQLVKKYDDFYKTPNNTEYQQFLDEQISENNLLKYLYFITGETYCYYDFETVSKVLEYFEINTVRDFERIYISRLTSFLKKNSKITADRIILYVIIINYTEKFLKNFGDTFTFSDESRELLKNFINLD